MKRSGSWLLLCALHAVASMLLWWAREGVVDVFIWRADGWTAQPWTLWTSAWVHLNTPQLIFNQIALGALTAFAWVLLAWPLGQLSLLWWPQIGYAVGLSGLLHAGVAVLAVQLLRRRIPIPKAKRWGGLLALVLLGKLLLERGWAYPVVWDGANDMSVVQAGHLSAAAWGLLLGLAATWGPFWRLAGLPPAPSAAGR